MALDEILNSVSGFHSMAQSKREILLHIKRNGPATAEALARASGLTASGARHQLNLMEAEGLISHRSLHAETPGRRRHAYEITAKGNALFPITGLDLALRTLSRLADSHPDFVAEAFAAESTAFFIEAERLPDGSASFAAKLGLLQTVLEERGFVATIEARGDNAATVVLCHCPVWPIAERFANVCKLEAGMMTAIFGDADLQLVEHRRDGAVSCRWTIREEGLASNVSS
jgi:predicted ArsR family transcriptional regulator